MCRVAFGACIESGGPFTGVRGRKELALCVCPTNTKLAVYTEKLLKRHKLYAYDTGAFKVIHVWVCFFLRRFTHAGTLVYRENLLDTCQHQHLI